MKKEATKVKGPGFILLSWGGGAGLTDTDICKLRCFIIHLGIHREMPGISSPTPKTRPSSSGISDAFLAGKAWKPLARLPHSKTGTTAGSRCPKKVRADVEPEIWRVKGRG